MFYYLTTYSFDKEKPVCGPFTTRNEAWESMRKTAEIEQKESETYGHEVYLTFDERSGEITLDECGECGDTVTTWILFEIR